MNEAGAMTGYSRAQLLRPYKEGRLRGHKKGKHVFFWAGGSQTAAGQPSRSKGRQRPALTRASVRVRGAWQRSWESLRTTYCDSQPGRKQQPHVPHTNTWGCCSLSSRFDVQHSQRFTRDDLPIRPSNQVIADFPIAALVNEGIL